MNGVDLWVYNDVRVLVATHGWQDNAWDDVYVPRVVVWVVWVVWVVFVPRYTLRMPLCLLIGFVVYCFIVFFHRWSMYH